MNKNYLLIVISLIMVALALYVGIRIGQLGGINTPATLKHSAIPPSNLSAVIEYINRYYVDSVDIDSISDKMIEQTLQGLDPHSMYIPLAKLQKANEDIEGNFEGIGVSFNMPFDTVVVINVFANGPSSKVGIHSGDRIVSINERTVAGTNTPRDSIMHMLRGKAGTTVQVKIKRTGYSELLPFDITRSTILQKSIDAAYMLAPKIGFVRINSFAKDTYSEFIDAINSLHSQGMTSLILDLRDNGGGHLEQVLAITSELFTDRKMILYTEGRAFPRENRYTSGKGKCGNDSLIVLINENSASASEILAGAVQDNDRGLIIGQRSFGKGLVQQVVPLIDGSALRLTIARYYTPSGRSIQRHYDRGSEGIKEYYNELGMRYLSGEHLDAEKIVNTDTTRYYTSKGRVVYGGGGITPDIFVPYEQGYKYFVPIRQKNLIFKYALNFSDRHRDELNRIGNINELDSLLTEKPPYNGIVNYFKTNGVNLKPNEIEESKQLIETALKASVSELTSLYNFGEIYYYNKIDKTVLKALSCMK